MCTKPPRVSQSAHSHPPEIQTTTDFSLIVLRMENQRPILPTDRHIPPTPEHPGPQQGEDPTIQNCSCAQCSDVQRTQAGPPTWYPIEQQDPRHFGEPVANQDQNVDNRAETAMIVPTRAWAQFRGIPLQTARVQNNFGYPPVHQSVGPPNMELSQAPTLDASIAESRRRLAGRYLNNPDAYVSTIRLEPGPSGQFQVIITLEMIDIV
ncbi:hypothetical protein EDB87DRAFT_1618938 [Lactarius vividus]|nr:hypothetical protein EDB87DRAFT_1618938 [Lactarius vividus]